MCVSDNHNNMCNIRAKELFDSTFKQLFTKYQFFNEIAPNFTYSQKIIIFKV